MSREDVADSLPFQEASRELGERLGSASAESTPQDVAPNPRASILAHLADDMKRAALAGDLEAVRICHEAIGKLVGAHGGPAAVVDYAKERGRRVGAKSDRR